MKTFDEYKDGDWVTYKNPKSNWDGMQFKAYKSQWTHNSFRLKYGNREVIADISEVSPLFDIQDASINRDADGDFSRFYGVQD